MVKQFEDEILVGWWIDPQVGPDDGRLVVEPMSERVARNIATTWPNDLLMVIDPADLWVLGEEPLVWEGDQA